ncbi:large conductance mechanosensitive channel protein MscL [Pseudonocardia sp. RS11V-5]|uniref:large conductance mechanosensitive channel protein MscL n=1 Tax=Pseudonocardia terrae TaxID=2905831 RepID=UPI001E6381AE|nr:large conductance mechanosensitive channel protein MscL [Pseudonocardia terrae]MCE3551307.1 large conductance mechanosensitive channel protein MscL [Pseudonocardia terrae]
MLKGFKDFILRGNVVDLAVAVVIGAAFTAIVTAFTGSIIQPLLNAITPPDVPALGIQLQADKPSTLINFSEVIAAAINFLIVASIVYFVFVLPIQTIKNRRKRGEEPGPAEPTDVELLAEIRDLLKAQADSSSVGRHQA